MCLVALAGLFGGVAAVCLFCLLRARAQRRARIVARCEFLAWRDRQAGTRLNDDTRFRLWSPEQWAFACELARRIAWARTRAAGTFQVELLSRLRFPSRDWPPVRDAFAACGWDLRETRQSGLAMPSWRVFYATPQVYVVEVQGSAQDRWTLAKREAPRSPDDN
jgi:hypothetical protein